MPSTKVPTAVVTIGGSPLPPGGFGGGDSQALLNHINDPVGAHAATAISYNGGAAWADGTTNPAATVEVQIDKFITDLNSTSITTAGTYRLGSDAINNTTVTIPAGTLRSALVAISLATGIQFAAGVSFLDSTAIPASSMQAAIAFIVAQLALQTSSFSGARKVGIEALTTWAGDGTTNPAASVYDAANKVITDLSDQTATTSGARKVRTEALTTWAGDSTTNPATTVYGALNKFVTDLSDQTATTSGARKVRVEARTDWADTTTNPATTVFGALDKIVTDLALQTLNFSGAQKIGIDARPSWLDGTTNPAGLLADALDKVITDLSDQTGATSDGASRIGAVPTSGLATNTVRGQLDELDTNWGKLNRENFWLDVQHTNIGLTTGDDLATTAGLANTDRFISYRHNQTAGISKAPVLTLHIGPGESIGTDNYNFRFWHQKDNGTGSDSLWWASNAIWNNTTSLWSHDNTANRSAAIVMDDRWVHIMGKGTGAAWADAAWANPFSFNSLSTLLCHDSTIAWDNTTSAVANPPSGTAMTNALVAKNVVKAWGTIFNDTVGVTVLFDSHAFNTVTTGSHTATTVTITFAQAFNENPCVVATFVDILGSWPAGAFAMVTAVTLSTFTVTCFTNGGAVINPTADTFRIAFIAMGEMNS